MLSTPQNPRLSHRLSDPAVSEDIQWHSLLYARKSCKEGPSSADIKLPQPWPCSSGRGAPAHDSQVLPFGVQDRTLTMEFGLSWVVLVAILQGNLWRARDTEDVSGYEWGNQWMCDSLLTRMSLCLQVSSVRCSWWSLGEAWCSLGVLWDSPVQPLDSPSVATRCTGSSRLQRRGWTESHTLVIVVIAQTMQTLWRADSLRVEDMAIYYCAKDTQWGEVSVSPDTIVSAGRYQGGCRGRSRPFPGGGHSGLTNIAFQPQE